MWEPQGLYSKFVLRQPTILFDSNSVRGLRNYPCSRVAVVHGKSLSDELKLVIEKSIDSFELKFIQKSWISEPVLDEIQQTIAELEQFNPDVIIAIGGGSVIDGTKIARLYYEFPFFDSSNPRFTNLEWKTKFIVIPTTIGSGAEISSAAVILNLTTRSKDVIVSHSLIPDVIIFDPLYVENSPMRIILLSALDAMAHLIEGYVSIIDNSITDNYAEKGLQNIYQILSDEKDLSLSDCNRLQISGYFGGIVQNHCIVGAAHAIAHQLAGYGFNHAEAITLVLGKVIEINSMNEKIKARYELLAANSGIGGVDDLLFFIKILKDRIKLSEREKKMKELVGVLMENELFIKNIQRDKGGKGNPIALSDEFVKKVLNSLLS